MIQYLCDRCKVVIKELTEPAHEGASAFPVVPGSDQGFIFLLPNQLSNKPEKFEVNYRKKHLCPSCTWALATWLSTPPKELAR